MIKVTTNRSAGFTNPLIVRKWKMIGLGLVLFLNLSFRSASQPTPASGYVQINGMKMYYEIHGAGMPESLPLIVLHGAYMNIENMGDIIPKLSRSYKVIALEMQGHGRTTDINRPITYAHLADDVALFMDSMQLEKADILGYSMGACAGLQLCIRHPEKVSRLISASGGYDIEGWQPAFKEFIPHMTVELFLQMPMAEEYKRLAANPDGFPELVHKLIQLEKEPMAWGEDLKNIKSPVLIIAGDADVSTLEHAVAMFRLLGGGVMGDMGAPLPASRLAILPASSHTAVMNQPDLLISIIDPFLKGIEPKGMF